MPKKLPTATGDQRTSIPRTDARRAGEAEAEAGVVEEAEEAKAAEAKAPKNPTILCCEGKKTADLEAGVVEEAEAGANSESSSRRKRVNLMTRMSKNKNKTKNSKENKTNPKSPRPT